MGAVGYKKVIAERKSEHPDRHSFEDRKSDWGTLVPRIKDYNVIKLGFVLE
jgi:hypothetical protein